MAKLEAATAEATAHIPLEKAPLLEEIYRVAKLEERYLAGGLGGFSIFRNFSAVLILTNQSPGDVVLCRRFGEDCQESESKSPLSEDGWRKYILVSCQQCPRIRFPSRRHGPSDVDSSES